MTKTQTQSAWKKCPSVTREGKSFYYHAARRLWAMQSWQDGQWRVEKQFGEVVAGPFATAAQAMAAAN